VKNITFAPLLLLLSLPLLSGCQGSLIQIGGTKNEGKVNDSSASSQEQLDLEKKRAELAEKDAALTKKALDLFEQENKKLQEKLNVRASKSEASHSPTRPSEEQPVQRQILREPKQSSPAKDCCPTQSRHESESTPRQPVDRPPPSRATGPSDDLRASTESTPGSRAIQSVPQTQEHNINSLIDRKNLNASSGQPGQNDDNSKKKGFFKKVLSVVTFVPRKIGKGVKKAFK
jgi:hypothetical protein